MTEHSGHGSHHQAPDETPDVSYIENPEVKHEESDVSGTTLMKFIGVTLVSMAIIMFLMKLMANYFEAREESLELPPASRVNPPGTQRLPPMPRLQGAPGSMELPLDDGKAYKAEQNNKVASYGWVNREAGIVRIPVDEAMKLILERGMPVVTGTPPAAPGAAQGAAVAPAAAGTAPAPKPAPQAPAHSPATPPRTN